MLGKDEIMQVPASLKPALKLGDIKFYHCPMSCITPFSWQLLELVNETIDGDGNFVNIGHLPSLAEEIQTIGEQKYREAVKIARSERARHRKEEFDKTKRR